MNVPNDSFIVSRLSLRGIDTTAISDGETGPLMTTDCDAPCTGVWFRAEQIQELEGIPRA
ncbi:MAG: hypothetical protein VYA30_09820 [Myxococcota bacterium]|nr:hypothetical protein [Myxococcota bacterium]